jgi:hypothetical protein
MGCPDREKESVDLTQDRLYPVHRLLDSQRSMICRPRRCNCAVTYFLLCKVRQRTDSQRLRIDTARLYRHYHRDGYWQ